MCSFRNCLGLSLFFLCALPLAMAQNDLCRDVQPAADACSFTALNGNCTLTIDRLRPVTPPLIYARHGSVITVKVFHPSPFEELTLDLGSATAQVPADAFAAAFNAISPNVEKWSMTGVVRGGNGYRMLATAGHTEVQKISQDQKKLLDALQPALAKTSGALADIQAAMQPPEELCSGEKRDTRGEPWLYLDRWKGHVEKGLTFEITLPDGTTTGDTNGANSSIQQLGNRIGKLKQDDATQDEVEQLKAFQKTLTAAVTDLDKITHLRKAIDVVYNQREPLEYRIANLQSTGNGRKTLHVDQNDLNEKWNLDYTNTLSTNVKRATANPPADPGTISLTDLTSPAPAKQAVVTIQVLFQTPPRIETSTGLMVPMLPYHSYDSAETATNGTVTGYAVQESLTYTVVPVVQVNFVAKDWVVRQRRAALFGTVAVGYNPTTSNVEFGVGPSFSWRTIVLSGLLDIGRDTKLAGGFTVGESLGTSSSAKPLTSTVWSKKPGVGISVRIPLSGSSSK